MADVSHASSLNLEPNPFEQSFASNTQQGHAPAASTDASASAVGPPGAAPHDQAKQTTQHFAAGGAGLDQKTPIPGIDKMLTPLPLAPGAPPFGAAGPLNAQLGLFGANSPAGWLPPRFGPITPGALNTPSLDAFAAQHAAGNVHTPHGFPQVAPGVPATHVQGGANATDVNVNGLPRGDAFGRPSQGVLPLESPGINALVSMTPAGVPAQISGVPGVHVAANAANAPHVPALQEAGAGPKPQGESAAANGLYMLSQNRSTENAQATPQAQPEKPRKGEPFTVPGETKRRASQQQPQHQPQTQQPQQQPAPLHPTQKQGLEPQRPNRPSVDSSASGSVDEPLSAVKPHVSRSRNNSSSKKRSSMDGDEDDVAVKSDGGAEDEHGEKRRWTNSQHSSDAENEEKRKQFLERNRIAAIKCRARKKQWVDNLQQKVDMYTRANDELAQKSDKMRADLDELRQFILRFHDMRSLPQHILHIVQGSNDPAGAGAVAAAGHDFTGMPSHVIAGAMAGALPGHAPLQAPMPPSVSSGPQSMASSIVPSPASQRTAPPRAADPRYAPHAQPPAQSPQSHYVPSRQQTAMQQPAMQHIHQTTQ